jgi:hypothetical protein
MTQEYIQAGTAVGVVMALIKLIEYIVGRFTNKTSSSADYDKEVALHEKMSSQLELMNTNHLNHIESAIISGHDKIVDAIQAMHIDLIKELNRK